MKIYGNDDETSVKSEKILRVREAHQSYYWTLDFMED